MPSRRKTSVESGLTMNDVAQLKDTARRSQRVAHGGTPRSGLTKMPEINKLIVAGILPRRAYDEEREVRLRLPVLPSGTEKVDAIVWGGGYGYEWDIVTATIGGEDRVFEEDEFLEALVTERGQEKKR